MEAEGLIAQSIGDLSTVVRRVLAVLRSQYDVSHGPATISILESKLSDQLKAHVAYMRLF